MEIGLQAMLLTAGFILLVKGADWFVDGAAGLAEKIKIPQLVIGLTIVAMGTSLPEAAVSISAAVKQNAEITVGNVMGSNILNILIILGLSAVVVPLAVEPSTIRRDLPTLLLATILILVQGLDGTIGPADGAVLLLSFAAYLSLLLRKTKTESRQTLVHATESGAATAGSRPAPSKTRQADGGTPGEEPWPRLALLTAAGLLLIVAGSHLTVEAASSLARMFGISERFIALTIVALGTSLPELFTSVTAAKKGNADIAIGNVVGSNIFNLLFVIGVSALVTPVPYQAAFQFDGLISGAAALLLLSCPLKKRKLTRRHGILMLFGYAVYFLTLL